VSWSIETKGEKIEVADAFYRLFGVCWRSASAAATAGRGVGVAVASSRASREEDEDDDVSWCLSTRKVIWAVMGCAGLEVAGLLCRFLLGCVGQVRSISFLFCFYFSVFNSVLYLLI
jgi:hypothetical protein